METMLFSVSSNTEEFQAYKEMGKMQDNLNMKVVLAGRCSMVYNIVTALGFIVHVDEIERSVQEDGSLLYQSGFAVQRGAGTQMTWDALKVFIQSLHPVKQFSFSKTMQKFDHSQIDSDYITRAGALFSKMMGCRLLDDADIDTFMHEISDEMWDLSGE